MARCSQCNRSVSGSYSMCYSCSEKNKQKKSKQFGSRTCGNCGARVTGDRRYCYSCFKKK